MTGKTIAPLKFKHSILIIDDEESVLNTFTEMLADEGCEIHTARNGAEGLAKLEEAVKPYSIIISDQRMPVMNGIEFFARAKNIFPEAIRILLTGYADTGSIIDAINKGGVQLYIAKPWQTDDFLAHIRQSLYSSDLIMENKRLTELIKNQNDELLELNRQLEKKVEEKTKAITLRTEELKSSYEKLKIVMEGTVQAMSKIVEMRDPYTSGHQNQVAIIACLIATEMGLPEDKIEAIRIAGVLHDIGKISVPSEILNKPGRLNKFEFELIKRHSEVAYDILKTIDFPYPIAEIILQHHERVDGSGYPRGLAGDQIMLEARILGVADVVEAMAAHRPYRPALGMDNALQEIVKAKGVVYDQAVVDACLQAYAIAGQPGFMQGENINDLKK